MDKAPRALLRPRGRRALGERGGPPDLDGPAALPRYAGQSRIGVHRDRLPDRGEERQVGNAVAVEDGIAQREPLRVQKSLGALELPLGKAKWISRAAGK